MAQWSNIWLTLPGVPILLLVLVKQPRIAKGAVGVVGKAVDNHHHIAGAEAFVTGGEKSSPPAPLALSSALSIT
ncbi:hypothetical protein HORIV_49660 [Vreelandella olivaria]|uniref:Uncharacterized protein n=1 Tax=Vreelandella olivaria TaxID=390919 RepID=A0ABN5X1R9_9GAMM|nr:hypothetical protein HORIV_49660 [Halomonas olivaria]